MATLLPSSFSRYQLTEQEVLYGTCLTVSQKQVIQNQIADLAEEKLSLKFDPVNVQTFLQREAELQGSISALKYLITLSESAEAQLNQPAQSTQES